MPSWVGYVDEFEKDGGGLGRQYRFFGQEARVKFWGLKGENPRYGWFAVSRPDGEWDFFPFAENKVRQSVSFGTGSEAKTVKAVSVYVFCGKNTDSKDYKLAHLSFIVKR